jgi:hypothetical protein
MEGNLHRIVYYSRNRVSGGPASLAAAVDHILSASQTNNAPLGITGALMFNAGCFGQVLEGRREVLESTFERIQRDERHSDVSLLAFEPVSERIFGNWSMGFVGERPDDARAFAGVAASTGFDPSRATSNELLRFLRALAIEDEATADA